MSRRAALLLSKRGWEAKRGFRLTRWRYYKRKRRQTRRTEALRRKWWSLYLAADRVCRRINATYEKSAPHDRRSLSITWAHRYIGTHETPAGSNRGPLIDRWQARFGFRAAPWCGIFVGNALLAAGVRGVTSRIASVGAIQADAEAHRGCFYGYSSSAHGALRGDAVILFGFGVHVELVAKVYGDGSVDTIGGNTSATPGSGSQSNGGCVASHHRSASEVHGVAHVRYS